MPADDQLKWRRHVSLRGADDEPDANQRSEVFGGDCRHRRRRLSCRDHAQRAAVGGTILHVMSGDPSPQFPVEKPSCVGRTNSSPGDRQEILSEIESRVRQCVCLGSDQAESPVTTSNFLRSELTNWGALACVESCSSWPMIRERAASTSVMALSE